MQHLWSPWRARHIESFSDRQETDDDGRSLFERLEAAGDDEASLILYRGEHAFVIMNLYPYNNGHVMIVPFRREADFDGLTGEEKLEIAELMGRCTRWLRRALKPEGFNIGMNLGSAAGAGVPDHLHVHVVPRWNGDTNFMPVVAEAKVIPEDIRTTYRKILAAIESDALQ